MEEKSSLKMYRGGGGGGGGGGGKKLKGREKYMIIELH